LDLELLEKCILVIYILTVAIEIETKTKVAIKFVCKDYIV